MKRAFIVFCLVACSKHDQPPPSPKPVPSASAPVVTTDPVVAKPIDVAGMDRSVKPGDDFFALRQRRAGSRATRSPPTERLRRGRDLAELTAKRTADADRRGGEDDAPPGSDARKIGDYYATFMDEAAIEAQGPRRRCKPALAAHRRHHATRRRSSRALGAHAARRRRRAQQHATSTPTTCSASGSRRTSNDPSRYAPFLLQGGLGHARPRLLPRRVAAHGGRPRRSTRRTSPALLKLAGIADADGKAARIFALEKQHRRGARARASTPRTCRRATTTGRASEFATRAAGHRLGRVLRRRRARRRRPSSSSGSRRR